MKKKEIAKKMGKSQEYGPQDKFTAKDVKKEKRSYKVGNGPEPAHSWET